MIHIYNDLVLRTKGALSMSLNYKDLKYILIVPFIIWASLPQLAYSGIARAFTLLCLGLLVGANIVEMGIQKNRKYSIFYFIIPIVICYMFTLNAVFSSKALLLRHLQIHIFLVFGLIAMNIIRDKPRIVGFLVFIILLSNLLITSNTIFGLSMNNAIARDFAKSNDGTRLLAQKGYAGYSLVYTNLLLIPFLFLSIKMAYRKKRSGFKWLLVLSILNIIAIYWLNLVAGYTMALGVSVLLIVMLPIMRRSKWSYGLISLIVAGGYYTLTKLDSILPFAYKYLAGTFYLKKLEHITISLTTSKNVGTVAARTDVYNDSFRTFWENPFIGNLKFDLGGKIGGHSDIIDAFAQWGGGIGLLIFLCVIYFYSKLMTMGVPHIRKFVLLEILVLLTVAMLNTVPLQFALGVLFAACIMALFPELNSRSNAI